MVGTVPAEVMKDDTEKSYMFKAFVAVHGHYQRDENIQVNGVVFLIDASNLTVKHQSGMNLADLKFMSRLWKVCIYSLFDILLHINYSPMMCYKLTMLSFQNYISECHASEI